MLSHQTFTEKGHCKKCYREIIIAEYAMDYKKIGANIFFALKKAKKFVGPVILIRVS